MIIPSVQKKALFFLHSFDDAKTPHLAICTYGFNIEEGLDDSKWSIMQILAGTCDVTNSHQADKETLKKAMNGLLTFDIVLSPTAKLNDTDVGDSVSAVMTCLMAEDTYIKMATNHLGNTTDRSITGAVYLAPLGHEHTKELIGGGFTMLPGSQDELSHQIGQDRTHILYWRF